MDAGEDNDPLDNSSNYESAEVKRERDRERNRVHARESRARKKKKVEDLESTCRVLEARKHELALQVETFNTMRPLTTIDELQSVMRGLTNRLADQGAELVELERDNTELRAHLAKINASRQGNPYIAQHSRPEHLQPHPIMPQHPHQQHQRQQPPPPPPQQQHVSNVRAFRGDTGSGGGGCGAGGLWQQQQPLPPHSQYLPHPPRPMQPPPHPTLGAGYYLPQQPGVSPPAPPAPPPAPSSSSSSSSSSFYAQSGFNNVAGASGGSAGAPGQPQHWQQYSQPPGQQRQQQQQQRQRPDALSGIYTENAADRLPIASSSSLGGQQPLPGQQRPPLANFAPGERGVGPIDHAAQAHEQQKQQLSQGVPEEGAKQPQLPHARI
mmetsp:Transcript_18477/g.37989  ORF Transcript_18477/g.37989 Transcript_18477/m.37989 type:complete len:381 (+) Transcript_18477:256-1398(+)|eukprot:CAMPEP_0171843298 /NCGR_PEP_ID=MMETSP0992-20121227/15768_1 /TAXON_ID=483369 /ORGANISM="non described non described, Strain CCMP2098" /LENGTH=380 /DNA_ID=CAMNT_0012460831 /DNA_START=170 /DNA_END=1312 /DNA_ORIENTATION=+